MDFLEFRRITGDRKLLMFTYMLYVLWHAGEGEGGLGECYYNYWGRVSSTVI